MLFYFCVLVQHFVIVALNCFKCYKKVWARTHVIACPHIGAVLKMIYWTDVCVKDGSAFLKSILIQLLCAVCPLGELLVVVIIPLQNFREKKKNIYEKITWIFLKFPRKKFPRKKITNLQEKNIYSLRLQRQKFPRKKLEYSEIKVQNLWEKKIE